MKGKKCYSESIDRYSNVCLEINTIVWCKEDKFWEVEGIKMVIGQGMQGDNVKQMGFYWCEFWVSQRNSQVYINLIVVVFK